MNRDEMGQEPEQEAPLEQRDLEVRGIPVEVVRKDIENTHIAVYPPDGHVRIAVPTHVDDEAARLAVIDRLGWIRRKRKVFQEQKRQSQREMIGRETHYVWGIRYMLDVVTHGGANQVEIAGPKTLQMLTRPMRPRLTPTLRKATSRRATDRTSFQLRSYPQRGVGMAGASFVFEGQSPDRRNPLDAGSVKTPYVALRTHPPFLYDSGIGRS
jgi:hypothetical protein